MTAKTLKILLLCLAAIYGPAMFLAGLIVGSYGDISLPVILCILLASLGLVFSINYTLNFDAKPQDQSKESLSKRRFSNKLKAVR